MHTHTFKTKRQKGELVYYMFEGNSYKNPIAGYEYSHSPEETVIYYVIVHESSFISVPCGGCFDTMQELENFYNND